MFDGAVERARSETTLIGQLSSVILSFAQLGEENRTAAAFAVTAVLDAQRDPELRELVGDLQAPTRQFLSGVLGNAVDRGELVTEAGIDELTETVLAVFWGIGFYVSLVDSQDASARVIANVQALLSQQLWQLRQPADGNG